MGTLMRTSDRFVSVSDLTLGPRKAILCAADVNAEVVVGRIVRKEWVAVIAASVKVTIPWSVIGPDLKETTGTGNAVEWSDFYAEKRAIP
ncbi:hypothetical protein Pcac1_g15555 [Phytophthora cactorum]|uniref:Uncharacterized protein n=1 Tax=Phytophthora cactorum TaxID=29920 RepID=A0A8T1B332_9STRA|nr:hypothetical protein Pcac1_g15555 [Phytophthora cactorum]KAG2873269.1 hypothetical protein PC114_g25947 [Phytophthora cactorum]KAG2894339.1 hypothetical protein PC117_g23516 [Phytophthora cactorum]KAG2966524.1 hypothetical protein PC119_g24700 [Phytophthora cactorum]